MDLTKDLILDHLIPNNYAIFIVNFKDGGQSMADNAEVILDILDKINELCPYYPVSIAGLSMGGVITRYALAKAEEIGRDHHCDVFISFDSPQQGANINPNFQGVIENSPSSNYSINLMQQKLQSTAAKQLLYFNVYDPDGQDNMHIRFYEELNTLNGDGYPHITENYAISNGTFLSTHGPNHGNIMMSIQLQGGEILDVYPDQRDLYAGSMISDITMKYFQYLFFNTVRIDYGINFNPVFIPTGSALDLVDWYTDPVTYDILGHSGSRFDDYIVQDVPLEHHILSDSSIAKIMEWLGGNRVNVQLRNLHENSNIASSSLSVDGLYPSIPSGEQALLGNGESYTFRTNSQKIQNNPWQHYNWEDDLDNYYLHYNKEVRYGLHDIDAIFDNYNNCAIQSSSGDISAIQIHDPWYKDTEGVQPDNFRPLLDVAPDNVHEVFLDQEIIQDKPYYSFKSDYSHQTTEHGKNVFWYFQKWISSGATLQDANNIETAVVFNQPNATVEAVYKGHLVHSPNDGYAENQRRVISDGSRWAMVYEDGGDIWYTYSSDAGQTWIKEIRLNTNLGKAKNPTLSNVFNFQDVPNDYEKFVIVWEETNLSNTNQIHVQTMRLTHGGHFGAHYGWLNVSDENRSTSYRVFNNGYMDIKDNAQPVAELVQNGTDIVLYIAFEDDYYGINAGTITFESIGSNLVESLELASDFSPRWESWAILPSFPLPGSEIPVLIFHPSVYGFNEGQYLYYIEPATSPGTGTRIVQYDLRLSQETPIKKTLSLPAYSNYVYSIQGAASKGNGMIQLVAQVNEGGSLSTAVYKKYPYYDRPYLTTTFTNMHRPSNMVENRTDFGGLYSEVVMRAYASGDHWYKSNNGTATPVQFTSDGFGAYTRSEVPTNDRSMMMVKYQSPHLITYYDGIGLLSSASKENEIASDSERKNPTFKYSTVVSVIDKKDNKKNIILSYDKSTCEMVDLDSLKDEIAIIKIKDGSVDNLIERMDFESIPISVEVKRKNKIIRSYQAINFKKLNRANFTDIQLSKDDQVILKIENSYNRIWSYNNIEWVPGSGFVNAQKESLTEYIEELNPIDYMLGQNYPNPFNPTTKINFTLPSPEFVELSVYNVNGQLLKRLVNETREAGLNTVEFNANSLASGVYFYKIKAGKFNQVKRMLLVK